MKVFLCGDYEFLTRMFGLSGASGTKNTPTVFFTSVTGMSPSGRHCCLWCLARSDQLKNPPSSFTLRMTDTIISDHHRFVAAGANLKRAKEFNNSIDEPFFRELPIDQVNTCNITFQYQINHWLCCRSAHQLSILPLVSSSDYSISWRISVTCWT